MALHHGTRVIICKVVMVRGPYICTIIKFSSFRHHGSEHPKQCVILL